MVVDSLFYGVLRSHPQKTNLSTEVGTLFGVNSSSCPYHSSYRQELEFTPPKDKSKHRSRNIIWFNPPYNKCISSNIGRNFLNLISKHFPNNSPLAKIFNKNNIKVSYSCTNNMALLIKKTHQKNRIHQLYTTSSNQCNCRVKSTCPLPNKCLYRNIIYKGPVKTNNSVKHYIGATEGTI